MSKVMEPSIEGPVAPPKLVHAIRLSLQEASFSGETTKYKLKAKNREGDPLSSKEKVFYTLGKGSRLCFIPLGKNSHNKWKACLLLLCLMLFKPCNQKGFI